MQQNSPTFTSFTVNPAPHLERLRTTRQPLFLTVDQGDEVVVLDADTFQQTRLRSEQMEELLATREAVDDAIAGRNCRSGEEFWAEFDAKMTNTPGTDG